MTTEAPVTPPTRSPEGEEGHRRVMLRRKVLAATPEAEREAIFQAVDKLFLKAIDKASEAEEKGVTLWHLAQNNAYLQVLKMLRMSKHIDPDMAIQGDEDVVHVD